jgi:hypothetical protein
MQDGKIRRIWRRTRAFVLGTEGALLTETLIVVPVVTIFAVGILEFGNVFWQRHQVQVAVRDAARYWARCRAVAPFNTCSQDIAHDLAFYGVPFADASSVPRVPGWTDPADLVILPAPADVPSSPTAADSVTVTGTHTYTGSPLMRLLQIDAFDFSYTHEQRYMGW